MTCHCGRDESHPEEHRGQCCDCFDSEVMGDTFREDPEYCAACDPGSVTYTVTVAGESDDAESEQPTPLT